MTQELWIWLHGCKNNPGILYTSSARVEDSEAQHPHMPTLVQPFLSDSCCSTFRHPLRPLMNNGRLRCAEMFLHVPDAIYYSRAITVPGLPVTAPHSFLQPTAFNFALQDIDSYCKATADSKAFAYHLEPEHGLQADRNKHDPSSPTRIHSNPTKWRPTISLTSSCPLPDINSIIIIITTVMAVRDLLIPRPRGAKWRAVTRNTFVIQ